MNIQFDSVTQNSDKSWTYRWTSTGTVRVVLWGVELATTTDQMYTSTVQGYLDFPPPVEVVASGELALTEVYEPSLVIQWYRDEGAVRYEVQQSADGSTGWDAVASVDEAGQWVYSYFSPLIADLTTVFFRVVAFDVYGNSSPAIRFRKYIVTTPAPVDRLVEVAYTAGNVVISGA